MANAEERADAYIGSYISLISKSEIRYQGFLYSLNPNDSTITLTNVKSFGTEGRKKEGPQFLASEKVYDFIFFQGSEIKDLHVISSPPVQSAPALPNDPAIIQSHYLLPASTPSGFSALSPRGGINAFSSSQYGLPDTSILGNPAYDQSAGILGSWGSLPPHPTTRSTEIARAACWPGHSGSSDGVSHFQEGPLQQTPKDVVPSPMQQQQAQHGLPNSSLQGNPAYNQSAGIQGPWGSLPPNPTMRSSEIVRSACWPGQSESSDEVSQFQERPLLQTPNDLVPSPMQQQQAQYGLPNTSLQENLAYNQSAGILAPWGSLPPNSTTRSSEIVRAACQPGHSGSSDGVSHFQERPSLQTPKDLVPSPMQHQPGPSSTTSASVAGNGLSSSDFSRPMLSVVSDCSPKVVVPLPPTQPSTFPIDRHDKIPHKLFSSPARISASRVLPSLPVISNSPSMDKPNSLLEPTLSSQSSSPPVPSFVRSSTTVHGGTSAPSLSNTDHILQARPKSHSLSQVHVAQKDIEVVQESTPRSLSSKSERDLNPTRCLVFTPKKSNEAAIPYHQSMKPKAQGEKYVKGADRLQKVGYNHKTTLKWLNGVASDNHHTYRGHGRGRGNELNQVSVSTYRGDKSRARGRRPKINAAAAYVYPNARGHGQWRRKQVPSKIVQFAEDFDFESMYEQFNKKEIWGHLGSRSGSITKEENVSESTKFDSKPVYAEDDFFDKFSCNLSCHENGRGKLMISEQKKLDIETFGESVRYHQRGYKGLGRGTGGGSRDSHSGRGHGRMPAYAVDDYFSTHSGNFSWHGSGKGWPKTSEQKKLDTETFGESVRHGHGHGSFVPGMDGRSGGSHNQRGRQMVWVRVT